MNIKRAEIARRIKEHGFAVVVELSSGEGRRVYHAENVDLSRFVPVDDYRRMTGDNGTIRMED